MILRQTVRRAPGWTGAERSGVLVALVELVGQALIGAAVAEQLVQVTVPGADQARVDVGHGSAHRSVEDPLGVIEDEVVFRVAGLG